MSDPTIPGAPTDTSQPNEPVLPSDEQTPKLLAGKYKSPEDLEKGYLELSKKLGAPKADPAPTKDPLKIEATADATKAVAKAGLDMEALSQEYQEKGELSAENLAALEAVGITKDVVDVYVEGQKALHERTIGKVHAIAGGPEQYAEVIEWAGANLDEASKLEFNEAVAGSPIVQKLAVENLVNKYLKANGQPPTGLLRGDAVVPPTSGYESRAQMTADMSDPRYAKDPAFRAKVEAKLIRTTAF